MTTSIKPYKTNFMLMHRKMQKSTPGFKSTTGGAQSESQARTEVGKYLLEHRCDFDHNKIMAWEYLLSCMDIASEGTEMVRMINWIRKNKNSEFEEVVDGTIDIMQFAAKHPNETQQVSAAETCVTHEVVQLVDDYRKAT